MLNTFIITELSSDLYKNYSFPKDIESLYYKELLKIAKNNNISGYSKKRKNSLIQLINKQIQINNYIENLDLYYRNKLYIDENFNSIFLKLLENKINDF